MNCAEYSNSGDCLPNDHYNVELFRQKTTLKTSSYILYLSLIPAGGAYS